MNGYRGCGTNIQWTTTQPLKRIMPFAATWMDLEIVILNEVRQRKTISYDIAYM